MRALLLPHVNIAPSKDEGQSYNREVEPLLGTGATETSNTRPLAVNHRATLHVGATEVRVAFRGSAGVSATVDATDLVVSAFSQFSWLVDPLTTHVYVEAEDGASAYEAWVWISS